MLIRHPLAVQARLAAAEERAGRSEWEAKDAIQKLERKVMLLISCHQYKSLNPKC